MIFVVIENRPAIQEQDRWFAFPDRFYHLCSPGKTARAFLASGRTGLDGTLYGTGVKDGDALVPLGKRANREKMPNKKHNSNGKRNRFI